MQTSHWATWWSTTWSVNGRCPQVWWVCWQRTDSTVAVQCTWLPVDTRTMSSTTSYAHDQTPPTSTLKWYILTTEICWLIHWYWLSADWFHSCYPVCKCTWTKRVATGTDVHVTRSCWTFAVIIRAIEHVVLYPTRLWLNNILNWN